MIREMILVGAVALTVSLGARAEDKPQTAPFDDAAFVKDVAVGGMYEVYLSDLVGPQTRNDDIKKFAVLMVTDHLEAKTRLKTAAEAAGIALPTKLDDAHQKQYDAFKDYKGKNRDRDYAKAMVKCHTEGVAAFTRASKAAKNPAVKDFATKTLPTLQKHLAMAQVLEKTLEK